MKNVILLKKIYKWQNIYNINKKKIYIYIYKMVEYIIEKIKQKNDKFKNVYYKIYKNGKKIKINKLTYDN